MLKSSSAIRAGVARLGWTAGMRNAPGWHAMRLIRRWIERSRQRRQLATFDARMLHDIGITRAQADRECTRPFWR